MARDTFAEAVNLLALVTSSLGKIALDVVIAFARPWHPWRKTAVFNLLTAIRQKVANFAGVTVGRKEGHLRLLDRRVVNVLDLPGAYSLNATSADEAVTRDVVLAARAGEEPLSMPLLRRHANLLVTTRTCRFRGTVPSPDACRVEPTCRLHSRAPRCRVPLSCLRRNPPWWCRPHYFDSGQSVVIICTLNDHAMRLLISRNGRR